MLSLKEFLDKYGESIYEDYSSTIVYACYNNNIEILNWLNNNFVKDDFMFCENIIEDLALKGNFIVLEWLYENYIKIFDNYPFIVNLLNENIIFKIKILKYYFNDNFEIFFNNVIKSHNINEITETFFRFYHFINNYIYDIVKKICDIGDIKMLEFLYQKNYFNDINFVMEYIKNINDYQQDIISTYICNNIINIDKLNII